MSCMIKQSSKKGFFLHFQLKLRAERSVESGDFHVDLLRGGATYKKFFEKNLNSLVAQQVYDVEKSKYLSRDHHLLIKNPK